MACIDIPALPLQLLLRDHEAWRPFPVVVVDKDKPQGIIKWANKRAHALRILPGMRYAMALSISRDVRGGVVADNLIHEAVALVTQRLWRFSPRIEPSAAEPGVFWLDPSGLHHVYPSLDAWADNILDELRKAHFHSAIAIGFSRFGVYATAKAKHTGKILFHEPAQEHAYLQSVPLQCLMLDPKYRDALYKLGIDTLGKFLALPAKSLRRRFGVEAEALHEMARGEGWTAITPVPPIEVVEYSESLEYPEGNLERLLMQFAGMLHFLVTELAARHELLERLTFTLKLDDGSTRHEEVVPGTPTLEMNQLLPLIRLRMETVSLSSPVVEFTSQAVGTSVSHKQLSLLHATTHPNEEAAQQAFAKLRARYGNDAVMCAHLREGHLPEARYAWEPLHHMGIPGPGIVSIRPLVRRIYTPRLELPPRQRQEPDGWMIAGLSDGPVEEVIGPQTLAGGWWVREVSRDYHYVRTRSGRWLWIYYDQKRRRWFLQGEVQ